MKNFDWKTYILKYPDLELNGIKNHQQAWNHYRIHGKNEGRTDKPLIVFTKKKILIIYVYYERKGEQKNQTNLAFFIKHGLCNSNWSTNNIETLFVINGHQCEVLIPNVPEINVLKEDNCSDWEGWYNGVKYMEKKYNTSISNICEYLCLINCSAFGPVTKSDKNYHWLNPFIDKMNLTNSVACSPCINILPETDAGGKGRRLVPIFTLLKINENIINLLFYTKIKNVSETSTNKSINVIENTVYGKKFDKIDAVLTGEYGLSRILLKNDYNICALLEASDYNRIDFKETELLKNSVFIKNIWRWDNTYVAKPVFYEYCNNFMMSVLNYTDELNDKIKDYSLINKNNNGVVLLNEYSNITNESNWNTLEDYYNKFGYSEETVVFPKVDKCNDCVIYAHYDSDNIIKDYVIQSLKILTYLGYTIIFYTASSLINNINLPFKINYFPNKGAGTDLYIWLDALQKESIKTYNWIMLLNDSVLLGINGIENMRNTIINMRNCSDVWAHWDSYEVNYHYIGTPMEIKNIVIDKFIYFLKSIIPTCKKKVDYILKIETKIIQYLKQNGFKTNCVIKVKEGNNAVNPLILKKWINNPETFAFKWKYHISYLRDDNIKSSYFKYLLRYLLTGNNVYISDGEKMKVWMLSNDYKQLDLFNKNS